MVTLVIVNVVTDVAFSPITPVKPLISLFWIVVGPSFSVTGGIWVCDEFGGGGGGGGGGGAVFTGGRFNDRPGETTPRAPTAVGAAAPAAGSESGEGGDAPPDASLLQQLGNLLRRPGQGGGGGGGGFGALNFVAQAFGRPTAGGGGFGGPQNIVATGDYLVEITVDGKKLTRVLRVERGK